ncbi:hypothetical protein HHK36_016064 [Tetracentron sinense]|uniref:Uncharacterized protein n=1 Tax=Tetracentron sinense TaxID=13715 RepID=A0A835DDV6_TETSI|nr:hypothetical protein HHK36_016064 [Tetracentron sinense]
MGEMMGSSARASEHGFPKQEPRLWAPFWLGKAGPSQRRWHCRRFELEGRRRELEDRLLQNNPDTKIFRSQTLEFAEDMEILFGGTTATGKAAWTPGRNSFPNDMLRTSHNSVDLTVDIDV